MSSIKFVIAADGNSVAIDGVCGVTGNACIEKTRRYEERLGKVQEATREFTEEYEEEVCQEQEMDAS